MNTPRRVAVLGAGTMGSRIAAHSATAGIPSLLLDVAAQDEANWSAPNIRGLETAHKTNLCNEGDMLRTPLALKRLTRFEPVNAIGERRTIARRLLDAERYTF